MRIAKLLLIGFSLLALSGCFGGDGEDPGQVLLPSENFAAHNAEAFFIQYPREWKQKSADGLEASFISNFKDAFFTPVITVEKVSVGEGVTSKAFAEDMISKNESDLALFEEIERKDEIGRASCRERV